MNASLFKSRQIQLMEIAAPENLGAIVLNPGPNLTHLTGLEFHLMERPVVGIFPVDGDPLIILPELEKEKVANLDYDIKTCFYNEDQATWTGVFKDALTSAGLTKSRVGVEPRRLRLLELSYLENACPEIEVISAQEILKEIRIRKSAEEVNFMAEAVRISECALTSLISGIKLGQTEKEVASRLVSRLLHEGSDPKLPFFPIVSFGENSANPHALPSDRVLKKGDLVLIDFGAGHQGYISDITRTFAIGDPNPELEQIAKFVLEANSAARAAVKPGTATSDVDLAAREVIERSGYGKYFFHRTGHGLGREGHEDPYISAYDQTILEPGMTFTIEPGIYLAGRGGVRIEDNVVVTDDGCRSLTDFPRELAHLEIID